jgi:hypothetical protein
MEILIKTNKNLLYTFVMDKINWFVSFDEREAAAGGNSFFSIPIPNPDRISIIQPGHENRFAKFGAESTNYIGCKIDLSSG